MNCFGGGGGGHGGDGAMTAAQAIAASLAGSRRETSAPPILPTLVAVAAASAAASAAADSLSTHPAKFFPAKLMGWTDDPSIPFIEWITVDGDTCVFIKDKVSFAAACYNGNFENFRRQLSEYAFKKVPLFQGHRENNNRAIYSRPGFHPGADTSRMRKELVRARRKRSREEREAREGADTTPPPPPPSPPPSPAPRAAQGAGGAEDYMPSCLIVPHIDEEQLLLEEMAYQQNSGRQPATQEQHREQLHSNDWSQFMPLDMAGRLEEDTRGFQG